MVSQVVIVSEYVSEVSQSLNVAVFLSAERMKCLHTSDVVDVGIELKFYL